jgi:predicted secreted protein
MKKLPKKLALSPVLVFTLCAALALLMSFGIQIASAQGVSENQHGNEINLGPENNGMTLDVGVESVIIIKLPENPTTGYTWQYTLNENIAEVMEDVYIPPPPENQIVGRGGTRMLKLSVIGRGEGEVNMDYVRPWENRPADHFSVILRVEIVAIPTTLVISPSSFTLQTSSSVALTATLRDSDNNPLAGKVISWSTSGGTISPTSGTTNIYGQISVTYTAPNFIIMIYPPPTFSVTASFAGDNQYQSSSGYSYCTMAAAQRSTTLSITPQSFILQSSNSITLTATLRDNANNPLAGKTMIWFAGLGNISPGSGTTNSAGQVSVTYTAPIATINRLDNIWATFAGDNNYQASSRCSYGTITVENENVKTSTTLSISPSSFTIQSGGSTTLTATLKDNTNNPLAGKTIEWCSSIWFDNVISLPLELGFTTTNSYGQASITYTADNGVIRATSVRITASFGDNQYRGSLGYSFGTITAENVVTIPTYLSISPSTFTLYPGENKTFIATLRVENNALANKTIIWNATAGRLSTSSGTTNSSGWTLVTYTAPQVTAQTSVTVIAYFMGDNQYQASYGSSSGTILPPPVAQSTSLSISPSYFALFPGYSGQVQSLIATLRDSNNNPLPNKTITCSATSGSINLSSGTTDALGQISAVYTAPTVTAETSATITMSFAGDDQYGPSSTTSSGIPATQVSENISASTGGTVVINVIGTNVTINVLAVQPNSLREDTSITVLQMPPENVAAHTIMSNIFDIGPNGTNFTNPVTLTLPYQLQSGVSEDNLAIYYYNTDTNSWERVGGNVNKVDKTVSVQVNHLSKYAVMAELAAAPQVEGGIPLIAVILAVLGVSAAAAASSAWIYLQRTRGEATSKLIEHGLSSMSLQEADIFREIRERKEFSISELMSQTGASKTVAWRTVQKLIKKGLVQPTEGVKVSAAGRGKPSTVYKYVGD